MPTPSDFVSYHEYLLVAGRANFAASWLPPFIAGCEPASSVLLILGRIMFEVLLEESTALFDPIAAPTWWETLSARSVPAIDGLWLVVLVTIAMSALVHGLTAGAVLAGIRADHEPLIVAEL